MPDELILAIDNGTQSLRALLFNLRGELVAKSQVRLTDYSSPHPGWMEYPPQGYWKALCDACQALWREHAGAQAAVQGVAVTTQRGTVINVDRNGQPLRPAIVWLDQRRSDPPALHPLWQAAFKLARLDDTIAYLLAQAESNWIKAFEPDVWRRTHKYLLLSGYLNYRLSGEFVDAVGSQVAYIPFDYRRGKWAHRFDWKWRGVSLEPPMLPKLCPTGSVMASVSASAASETGIPAGTPVVAAAADKACEVLGAGCVEPHTGCISYGTAATINVTSRRYLEVTRFIPPYPAALPGAYSLEVQVSRGYWMVDWFKEQFAHPERDEAALRGIPPEDLLDELVGAVPPGSMGLMLQPYWSPGIKVPGPDAKGAVIGFGAVHTRSHLYRAILEGIAYALRDGKERIEKNTGTRMSELRVCGGGSQSDAAMQLTADVFGIPAARPHVYEASGLGAAIDAAVGLKLHPDFRAAVAAMTRVERVFEPQTQNREIYEALYRRVYRRMYPRLESLYKEIRSITGYPA